MRVHGIRNAGFEGYGHIEPFLNSRGIYVVDHRPFEGGALPSAADFDALIVMGGPMGAFDDETHPWLPKTRALIKAALDADKRVLGICLGAQLMAGALGARVEPNPEKEIGWHQVRCLSEAGRELLGISGIDFTPLHWHGDAFEIPSGALHLFSSRACAPQGFILGRKALGLQFHLEATKESVEGFLSHCGQDLAAGGRYVSRAQAIRDGEEAHGDSCRSSMENLLSSFLGL
jgi:GMP synthase-like glutamine amidotransferase